MLSRRFGSWDPITPDPESKQRYLCLPCGWAYRAKELQHHATILTKGATRLHHPGGTELRRRLAGPIDTGTTILVPVTGKKAVAPLARWGAIAIDSGSLTWTRCHLKTLTRLTRLKELGIPEPTLYDPAPPAHVLDALDAEDWQAVQEDWHALSAHRQDKDTFPALVKLTREKL